jgi:acetylornithine deacetylase/succinyl-diaminopimelate desuccinylase-like protein
VQGRRRTHSSLAGREDAPSAVESVEGALSAIREQVPALRERHPLFGPRGRLTVVRIDGGEGYGVVPSTARAELELRLAPGARQEAIEGELVRAVAGLPVELAFEPGSKGWMAPSEIARDHPLTLSAAAAWQDVLGEAPTLACFPGGTDARLFCEAGFAALSGVGPGALVRAHHPDEFVTINELDTAVRLYAAIVARFAENEENR